MDSLKPQVIGTRPVTIENGDGCYHEPSSAGMNHCHKNSHEWISYGTADEIVQKQLQMKLNYFLKTIKNDTLTTPKTKTEIELSVLIKMPFKIEYINRTPATHSLIRTCLFPKSNTWVWIGPFIRETYDKVCEFLMYSYNTIIDYVSQSPDYINTSYDPHGL